jgi:DNA-binding transcriptional LysR family regulator
VIARYGPVERPQDLADKPCVIDTNGRWLSNWPFVGDNGQTFTVSVNSRLEVNSPMAARAAAVSGLGWAVLPDFIAEPDIRAGRLVPTLDDRMLKGGGIFAVYPHRRYLPAKVRVFVDFLVQWFRKSEG